MLEIAPSILSADFTKLGEQIRQVEAGGALALHVDVMDGRFVPNITVGLPIVKSIRKFTDSIIDVHLMIVEPARYAVEFVESGANRVSFHIEADAHAHRTLTAIKEAGAQVGICINPSTALVAIEEVLPLVDFVNVMSVNPGFGGQKFIPLIYDKVRRLRQIIVDKNLTARIEIDGGVDHTNIQKIVAAGAEIIVAGSAVFSVDSPTEAVRGLINQGTNWT